MSRGTPLTPLRLSAELLDRIDAEVERQNRTRAEEPYNRTSWIRQAIEERLAKLERGRKAGQKRADEQTIADKGIVRSDIPPGGASEGAPPPGVYTLPQS